MAELSELAEQIKGVHGGKNSHTTADLEKLVRIHLSAFDNAISGLALEPYNFSASSMLKILEDLKKTLQFFREMGSYSGGSFINNRAAFIRRIGPTEFRFFIKGGDAEEAAVNINNMINDTKVRDELFKGMYETVMHKITLEVVPNPDLENERVYLAQGRVIIPTNQSPGYQIFKLSPFTCQEGCFHVKLKQITSRGYSSVDEALDKGVDPAIIGTIAIAKNTEMYPLRATSIPIVELKYENAIRRQNGVQ